MIKILVILSECLSVLIWLHICFKQSIKQSKGKLFFCIVYVLYFYLISNYGTNMFLSALPLVLILVWSKVRFNEALNHTIIKYIISLIGVGISQYMAIALMYLTNDFNLELDVTIQYVVLGLISLLFSIVLYCFPKKGKMQLPKMDAFTVLILLFAMGMVLYIKYDYNVHKGLHGYLYIVFLFLVVFFALVILKIMKSRYELEQKRLELDVKERYEEVYSMLLLEMRRKQHDFNNQVFALYSIQLADKDKDGLTKLQRQYGDELLKVEKYDSLILQCNCPVLSGYVYTKCNEIERVGIEIYPRVVCTKSNYNIGTHEIIELLGILLNNAEEYLLEKTWEYKAIKINIYEKLNSLYIEVENVAEYISYEDIGEMFDVGYSTKGKERGIGLYSLKKIVEKNKGKLIVENKLYEKNNWLKISVVF